MKYMLLIYGNEGEWQGLSKSEADQRMAAYRAYTEALTGAGAMVGGDRLRIRMRRPRCGSPAARPMC